MNDFEEFDNLEEEETTHKMNCKYAIHLCTRLCCVQGCITVVIRSMHHNLLPYNVKFQQIKALETNSPHKYLL